MRRIILATAGVAVLARGVGQPVVGVRVLGLALGHAFQKRDRLGVLLGLDRLHRGGVLGVLRLGGRGALSPAPAGRPGRAGKAAREERERHRTSEHHTTKQCEHGWALPAASTAGGPGRFPG